MEKQTYKKMSHFKRFHFTLLIEIEIALILPLLMKSQLLEVKSKEKIANINILEHFLKTD